MTSYKFQHTQARKITSNIAWLTVIVGCIPISDKLKLGGGGGVHYKTNKIQFFKPVMFNRFTQVQENKLKSQGISI